MSQSPEASTVQKKGNISKCPSCGAQLGSFVTSCESCGHEFSDIEANRSITALVNRFEEIDKEVDEKGLTGGRRQQAIIEKKARVIRDFPVPNSREDLQQLLYYIQPKLVDSVKPDPNIEDWRAKFAEVLNRAKNAYKNDSSSLAEFDRIERSLQTTLADDLQIKAKRNPLFVILLVGVLAVGLIWFVASQIERSKIQACEEKYAQGSKVESDRLEKLFASVDQDLKAKKYPEALATSAKLQWEFESACKVEENQKTRSLWNEKRGQIASSIQKGIDADAAGKTAEADRLAAEKQAEVQMVESLARIEADRVTAKAAAAQKVVNTKAAAAEKVVNDKKW